MAITCREKLRDDLLGISIPILFGYFSIELKQPNSMLTSDDVIIIDI